MTFKDRKSLEGYQIERLNDLLQTVMEHNSFYKSKFAGLPKRIDSLEAWSKYPTTTKLELSRNADEDGLAPHHTFAAKEYNRLHRTSGSTGRPLMVMDRREDWDWWLRTWQVVLDAAKLKAGDAIFMAFSFGPFIGFWSANDACLARGCRTVPGGGLSTAARIDLIQAAKCSVLFTTPSYALHLAEEAKQRGFEPAKLGIRKIIVAGEPGGSIDSVRKRIETFYDALLVDHAGATEVGPWGVGTADGRALEVIEQEFIAEFLPVSQNEGESSHSQSESVQSHVELVLTSLGRVGVPALRYRTGDLVRPAYNASDSGRNVRLEGGVIGRVDQMLTIRGVNVIPSSIEAILRDIPSVGEYRLIAYREGERDQLKIEVEDAEHDPAKIVDLMNRRLGLRVEVIGVEAGSLFRSVDKAKRFIDQRPKG
jgi:phenylacetate-CoA ligase